MFGVGGVGSAFSRARVSESEKAAAWGLKVVPDEDEAIRALEDIKLKAAGATFEDATDERDVGFSGKVRAVFACPHRTARAASSIFFTRHALLLVFIAAMLSHVSPSDWQHLGTFVRMVGADVKEMFMKHSYGAKIAMKR